MKYKIAYIGFIIGLAVVGTVYLWVSFYPFSVKPMSNDEIIQEIKKCEDAGFDAITYPRYHINIEKIVCHPKTK